ncbi:MAG: hypothetical protein HLUCCO02_07890 [Idiomarinaceae bacterium HL-53]|nr:MAG: hypothetical protein HLUCCO02_07890 [Idiomarinaceae bacterium HL-53]CUS47108.1 hypothetical protein Ga0003345_0034 [Idiomarinaceae bacterium HL-53]
MKNVHPLAYGQDAILREYLQVPGNTEINFHAQHGFKDGRISKKDLRFSGTYFLVWSQRIKELMIKESRSNIVVAGAPFVKYRQLKNWTKSSNAAGTIAFPQHSTNSVKIEYDVEDFCERLLSLSIEFKPITVCLHIKDYSVQKEYFEGFGFNVVTAGGASNGLQFTKNFYDILLSHKYCVSNDIGSPALYALEASLPFSLIGHEPKLKLTKDGSYIERSNFYYYLREMFSPLTMDITNEQYNLVQKEVGNVGNVSRKDLIDIISNSLEG